MAKVSFVLYFDALFGRCVIEKFVSEFVNFHFVNKLRRGGYMPVTVRLSGVLQSTDVGLRGSKRPIYQLTLEVYDYAHSVELEVNINRFFFENVDNSAVLADDIKRVSL